MRGDWSDSVRGDWRVCEKVKRARVHLYRVGIVARTDRLLDRRAEGSKRVRGRPSVPEQGRGQADRRPRRAGFPSPPLKRVRGANHPGNVCAAQLPDG